MILVQSVLKLLSVSVAAGMCEYAVPGGEQEGNPAVVVWRIFFSPLGGNLWEHPDLQLSIPELYMSEFGTHY